MMSDFNDYICDELSVEANGDQPLLYNFSNDASASDDFDMFLNEFMPDFSNVDGVCNVENVADSIAICESNDLNSYINPILSTNVSFDIDQNLLAPPPVLQCPMEKTKKKKDNKKSICLSSSVGVGVPMITPQPTARLQIANELEETYRPRYKSDYFGQNGRNRKPRYVTDRKGNHYILLKVPPNTEGGIRVDWVTIPGENNERHLMPYKFQASNESLEVSDCNPIVQPFKSDGNGTVKLYLVLIKAKQDALKSLQPLQPFHPFQDAFGIVDKPNPEKLVKLTPKQLIQKYQLGKSELAFTLCTLSSNGQFYVTEWDTTVYSTVLEEVNETASSKTICCPKCSCPITINDEIATTPESKEKKRKNVPSKTEKLLMLKKQRTLPDEILPIIYG